MATKKKKTAKKTSAKKTAKSTKKAVKKGKRGATSKKKRAVATKKSSTRKKGAVKKKKVGGSTKKRAGTKKQAGSRKKALRAGKKGVAKKKSVATKKKAAPKKKSAPKKKVTARKKAPAKKKAAPRKPKASLHSEKRLPPPQPFVPHRPVARVPERKRKRNIKKLTAKELREYRQALLNLRDKVVDGISFLSGDNLNRSQRETSGDLSGYSLHMADQGTDNYDREFALNLVSSEQDILYEIDEAIRRIDEGKYGICEFSGEPIERARLKVLPYARYSVAAQSEMERGKTHYRPFGPTLSHGG